MEITKQNLTNMSNSVKIKLKNGKPEYRGVEVELSDKQLRLLKCNGKEITIWSNQLIFKKL